MPNSTWVWIVHLPSRDITPTIISHNIVFVQIARCISLNFQLTNIFVQIDKFISQYCKMYLYLSLDCAFVVPGHCTYHYITQYCICTNWKMYSSKLTNVFVLVCGLCICRQGTLHLSSLCICQMFTMYLSQLTNVFVNIAKCICTWVWIVYLPSRDIAPSIISHNSQPLMKFLSALQDLFIS